MFAGEQFLLVGDAGLFIDPLSSEGVHKAMASAITGAIVINTILKRPAMIPSCHSAFITKANRRPMKRITGSRFATTARNSAGRISRFGENARHHQVRGLRSKVQRSTQSPIPNPQSVVHNAQRVSTLRIAPGVTIEQRPVIEGPFIELREVVVAPLYPRGIRILQQVHLPKLLTIVRQQSAVGDIMTQYLATTEGKNCPPETVRQTLARLYQEEILVSADVTETG